MTAPAAPRSHSALEAGAVWAVVSALYLATLSGNHSETEDSLNYAARLRDDPQSDAPHLVFDWVAWLVYNGARSVGLVEGSLRPMQAMNAVIGAGAVSMLWLVLRHSGQRRLVAFTASGLLACSYAFWWNSVEAEVYALSALSTVVCLALALRAVERGSWQAFAILGIANGIAVLAHLQNVYFAGVAVVGLVLASRSGRLRRWWPAGLAYVAGVASVVVLAFGVAAAVIQPGSVREFQDWFTETTGQGQFGNVEAEMIPKGAVGAGRALIGGHYILSLDGVKQALAERFPDRPLVEEYFLIEGFPLVGVLALISVSLLVALCLLLLAASWVRRTRLEGTGRTVAILCAAWIASYLPMLLVWDPFNTELWYVAWIPGAVLLALPLGAASSWVPARWGGLVSGLVVGGLFVVNLAGAVWPQHDSSRDYWNARVSWYRANARASDLIVARGYVQVGYLDYYTPAKLLDVQKVFVDARSSEDAVRQVMVATRAPRGGRVFVSDQVFHPYSDAPAGCATVPESCPQAALLRTALLERARVVSTSSLERVYELQSET